MKMELFQKKFNADSGSGSGLYSGGLTLEHSTEIGDHFRRYADALRFAIGLHGA